jgi:hypothetical protein
VRQNEIAEGNVVLLIGFECLGQWPSRQRDNRGAAWLLQRLTGQPDAAGSDRIISSVICYSLGVEMCLYCAIMWEKARHSRRNEKRRAYDMAHSEAEEPQQMLGGE